VIDVWSRKVVAWDVAERVEAQIAADFVGRARLRERISKGRLTPLILHADNGNAMRAAALESGQEELGVLRSFSLTEGEQRQPLLGVAVPHGEIPAGLPTKTVHQHRAGPRQGGGVRELAQPPAPPKRSSRCDQQAPHLP
jgi:hypothetical protein